MELRVLFTPKPSPAIVKCWQGIVEVVLRSVCIGLTVLAFICAVALVRDLGAPDTPIQTIENLRFNTRSPSGWILLVVLIALPLEIIILIARFLNFPIVNKYSVIFLVVDACINFAIALFFFGGAVALGTHAQDWAFWRGRGTPTEVVVYGLDRIVPSVGAGSAFSFFASFGYITLGVYMILFVACTWNKYIDEYIVDPKTVEAKESDDTEADTQPVTEKEDLGGQHLEFSEEVTDM